MRATLWVLSLVLAVGVSVLADDGSVAWPTDDGSVAWPSAIGEHAEPQRYWEWKDCWIVEFPDGSWCIFCIEYVCVEERLDEPCLIACMLACLPTGKLKAICTYLCQTQCVRCTRYELREFAYQCYGPDVPRPKYHDTHPVAPDQKEFLP